MISKVIEVGVPPTSLRDDQSVLLHFHDFQGLSSNKGSYEESGTFKLFNYQWNVFLYPGGDKTSPVDDMVTIGLGLYSKGIIEVKYWLIVRDASGEIIEETRQLEGTFDGKSCDYVDLLPRTTLLERALNNGTFTIELRMTPVIDSKSKYCNHFIPANRAIRHDKYTQHGSIISSLLFDEESADICFDVNSPSDETKQSVQVYAHRNILKARAPDLFRLCAGYDVSNPMPINDVEPDIFRELMRFIYGLRMDNTDWEVDSKNLLEAANKYDVANLKVTAEAWYVTCFDFTAENVADQLLFADAMSCPLLKEEAIKFIVDNGVDVFSSGSFNTVLEARDITLQILQALAKKPDSSSDSTGADSMSIDDLRIRLDEYSFAVDGDREMLIRRFVDLPKSNVETVEFQEESETQEEQDQINADDADGDDDQNN